LVPEYKKAATALKGIVRLGAVNADEHRSLGTRYGVQGFPTLKVFGSNKNSPSDYRGKNQWHWWLLYDSLFSVLLLVPCLFVFVFFCTGGRTADAIVQEALSVAKTVANDRLHGKGGSGGGGGGSGGGKAGDPKDVIELTDGNFEELVINSEDYWLVEFYAPW